MSKHISLKETGRMLEDAQSIVLCCHVSPDGDTLGSALGLMHALDKLEKKVTVLVDDDISKGFRFLPGIERCLRPQKEDTINADLFVVVDASSFDRVGIAAEVVKAPVLMNIDHHVSNTEFADYLYLDTNAAATGEIMCDLYAEMDWQHDEKSALCFYTAISTDCGSFRYSNTTSKTMQRAAHLLDYGVVPSIISDNLDMRSRATAELLSKVLPSLTFEYDGKVAYIAIPNELYDKDAQTDSFVSYPRYIEGVDVAIMFKAVEEQVIRVSMRSSKTDVAQIALSFGGGGHVKAAGCTINATLEEAKKLVLAAIGKAL